jgi:cystathionine beta-lyase/cystathionine gamma-synthase
MKYRNVETLLVHAGAAAGQARGAVGTPIFQTTTFGEADREAGVRYTRLGNGPNQVVLEARLAALAGADDALVTASGMAAIATTLLTLLGPGQRVLVQRGVYGGTSMLLQQDLERLGIACDIAPNDDPHTWDAAIQPETRAIFVEAITNPLLRIIDHTAVVALARRHELVAVIDATFASPMNFQPLALGFDLEIHSMSKYLNGHTDVIAGVVMGRQDLVSRVRATFRNFGPALDPHAAFLVERGLKTLALRVRHQNASATGLARFLATQPAVAAVHYPTLEDAAPPPHITAHFKGFGGVLAFAPKGGGSAAEAVLRALRIATWAPSLGGSETLVTRPAGTSHAGLSPEARAALGIHDGLIRVACGLEGLDDLIADFDDALRTVQAS